MTKCAPRVLDIAVALLAHAVVGIWIAVLFVTC